MDNDAARAKVQARTKAKRKDTPHPLDNLPARKPVQVQTTHNPDSAAKSIRDSGPAKHAAPKSAPTPRRTPTPAPAPQRSSAPTRSSAPKGRTVFTTKITNPVASIRRKSNDDARTASDKVAKTLGPAAGLKRYPTLKTYTSAQRDTIISGQRANLGKLPMEKKLAIGETAKTGDRETRRQLHKLAGAVNTKNNLKPADAVGRHALRVAGIKPTKATKSVARQLGMSIGAANRSQVKGKNGLPLKVKVKKGERGLHVTAGFKTQGPSSFDRAAHRLGKKTASTALVAAEQVTRPIYGIAGATYHGIKPGGPGVAGGFKAGVTLKDKKLFSDVLQQAGAPKWVSHVAGFGLDVALDPTTYVSFGTAVPAEVAAKGAYKAALAAGKHEVAKGAMSQADLYREALATARKVYDAHPGKTRGATLGWRGLPVRAATRVTRGKGNSVRHVTLQGPVGKRITSGTAAAGSFARSGGRLAAKPITSKTQGRVADALGKTFVHDYRPRELDPITHMYVRDAARDFRAGRADADRKAEHRATMLVHELRGVDDGRRFQIIRALESNKFDGLNPHETRVAKVIRQDLEAAYNAEVERGLLMPRDEWMAKQAADLHKTAVAKLDKQATKAEKQAAKSAERAQEKLAGLKAPEAPAPVKPKAVAPKVETPAATNGSNGRHPADVHAEVKRLAKGIVPAKTSLSPLPHRPEFKDGEEVMGEYGPTTVPADAVHGVMPTSRLEHVDRNDNAFLTLSEKLRKEGYTVEGHPSSFYVWRDGATAAAKHGDPELGPHHVTGKDGPLTYGEHVKDADGHSTIEATAHDGHQYTFTKTKHGGWRVEASPAGENRHQLQYGYLSHPNGREVTSNLGQAKALAERHSAARTDGHPASATLQHIESHAAGVAESAVVDGGKRSPGEVATAVAIELVDSGYDLTSHEVDRIADEAAMKALKEHGIHEAASSGVTVARATPALHEELSAVAADALDGILPVLKKGGELSAEQAQHLREYLSMDLQDGGMLTADHMVHEAGGVTRQRASAIERAARKLLASLGEHPENGHVPASVEDTLKHRDALAAHEAKVQGIKDRVAADAKAAEHARELHRKADAGELDGQTIRDVAGAVHEPEGYWPRYLREEVFPLKETPDAKGGSSRVSAPFLKGRTRRKALENMKGDQLAEYDLRIPEAVGRRLQASNRAVNLANFHDRLGALGQEVPKDVLELADKISKGKAPRGHALATAIADLPDSDRARLLIHDGRGYKAAQNTRGHLNLTAARKAAKAGQTVVLVPKDAFDHLSVLKDRGRNVGDVEDRGVLKGYDKVQGHIKTAQTVVNPGYHITNLIGDSINAKIGGATARDFVRAKSIKKAEREYDKSLRSLESDPAVHQGKTEKYYGGEELSDLELAKEAIAKGAAKTGYAGHELNALVQGEAKGAGAMGTIRDLNERREDLTRLASYYSARKRMSADEAAEWVNKHHFDYGDLTDSERKYLRRVIPFYTFMARNTRLQVGALGRAPGVLANEEKARQESTRAADMDPDFAKTLRGFEQQGMPWGVPRKVGGLPLMLFPKTPMTDLNNVTLSPQQLADNLLNRSSPIIKTIIEQTLAYNTFTRADYKDRVPAPSVFADPRVRGIFNDAVAQSTAPIGGKEAAIVDIQDKDSGKMVPAWSWRFDQVARQIPALSQLINATVPTRAGRPENNILTGIGYVAGPRPQQYSPNNVYLNQLNQRAADLRDEMDALKPRVKGHHKGDKWVGKIGKLGKELGQVQKDIYKTQKAMGVANPSGTAPAKPKAHYFGAKPPARKSTKTHYFGTN